jgi:hypothetical protein
MALVIKDRVKETTDTTGTGTLTLNGAAASFQGFSAIGDGNATYYAIIDQAGNAWEVGLGTYTASGTTLSRDTILDSSNSGSAINLTAGSKSVFATYPSEKSVFLDASGNLTVEGNLTVNGTTTTVNAENLAVADNMIYMNDGNTVTNPDLGFAGNYNDGGYAHAGFFRDATDGRWKAFDSYTPEPDASPEINTAHASFNLSDIQAANFIGDLTGDVTGNADTASALATARTISLTGDVSGSASFDGSANVSITATVADDSHAHVIGDVDGLQAALDTKQAAATSLTTSTSFGGDVSGTYNAIVVADDSHNHVISNVDGLQTALDAKVDLSGDTMTGNLSFGDNDKAIFGAGSDLQIYSDGNSSYISEVSGTGSLEVKGSHIYLVNSEGDYYARFLNNYKAEFYYDGASKLETTSTGIDVTGTVTADGVGIGTSSPASDAQLTISNGGGADVALMFNRSATGQYDAAIVNTGGHLAFKNGGDVATVSGLSERMRIDNIGNVVIGATAQGSQDALTLSPSGYVQARVSGTAGYFDRLNSDGTIAEFRKDGSTVGSIGTRSSNLSIGSGDVSLEFNSPNDAILPSSTSTNNTRDAAIDLGLDTVRFKDLYLSGGIRNPSGDLNFYTSGGEDMRLETDGDLHVDGDVIAYSTTISDERLKDNIVGIDGALDKVSQLNGYTFNYKADGKVSAGVIAQEVEKVLPEAVSEKELPLKADDGEQYKVVNYDALHGLLIEAIKELKAEIAELKAK